MNVLLLKYDNNIIILGTLDSSKNIVNAFTDIFSNNFIAGDSVPNVLIHDARYVLAKPLRILSYKASYLFRSIQTRKN